MTCAFHTLPSVYTYLRKSASADGLLLTSLLFVDGTRLCWKSYIVEVWYITIAMAMVYNNYVIIGIPLVCTFMNSGAHVGQCTTLAILTTAPMSISESIASWFHKTSSIKCLYRYRLSQLLLNNCDIMFGLGTYRNID